MPTIGQKLGETRRKKGVSVDDVAHETRIHPNMILSIEEDDFSQFPSVAYAKSFIRKYGEYLGVDLSSAMEELNSGTTIRLSENELMGEMKKTIHKDRRFRQERSPKGHRRRLEKPGGAPLFLNFILLLMIVSLGFFYFLGYRVSSMEEAKREILKTLSVGAAEVVAPDGNGKTPPPGAPESPAMTPASENPEGLIGTANPGSGTAPVYPAIKPEVKMPFNDTLIESPLQTESPGDITGNPLRPRNTPRMVFAEEPVKPLSIEDLPAVKKPAVEPQAVLRPEGTDPASAIKEDAAKPPSRAPGQNAGGNMPPPRTPLRAVPVAASE